MKSYEETLNAVGTVTYMPPEVIYAMTEPDASYVGKPADAWSLGCCRLLYEVGDPIVTYNHLVWAGIYAMLSYAVMQLVFSI